jgi:hypothetical protein
MLVVAEVGEFWFGLLRDPRDLRDLKDLRDRKDRSWMKEWNLRKDLTEGTAECWQFFFEFK